MHILKEIGVAIVAGFVALGSLFAPAPAPSVGAALPAATAVFETSLAAPISSSATSMTLSANSVRGGGTLSGYNCFTVDEGSAQAETICGTVSGTSVTSLTRGVSQSTGTTTVAALQYAHRRGADVKITDYPVIQILKAQANGEDTFPHALTYDSGLGTTSSSFPSTYSIPNRGYVDAAVLDAASVIGASETASGFSEIATAAEAAAGTTNGSSSRLVLPASLATSTYNSATAANVIPVTNLAGKIDTQFIATSTFYTDAAGRGLASTTYVGSFPAYQIGKNIRVITTTGTSTLTVPTGISRLIVEVQAAGGGGGTDCGGGGGGYSFESVDVSATSSIQVYVGAGGTGNGSGGGGTGGRSTFGTIGSEFLTSNGGTGGGTGAGCAGGTGGSASEGDLNIPGGSAPNNNTTGWGASAHLGFGGVVSAAGGNYGGGGGKTANGSQGIVIVRW